MPKYEIEKMWTVSTAHITESDNAIMEAVIDGDTEYDHLTCWVMSTGFGFILWVPSDDMDGILEEYKESGFSDAICALVREARDLECAWIRLDNGVPPTEGLPIFNW
jgi:hypothetical protein